MDERSDDSVRDILLGCDYFWFQKRLKSALETEKVHIRANYSLVLMCTECLRAANRSILVSS